MDVHTHIWVFNLANEELGIGEDLIKAPFTFSMEQLAYYRPAFNEDGEVIKSATTVGINGEELQIEMPYNTFKVKRDKWRKMQHVGLS